MSDTRADLASSAQLDPSVSTGLASADSPSPSPSQNAGPDFGALGLALNATKSSLPSSAGAESGIGNGQRDRIATAARPGLADVSATTTGQLVHFDAGGHPLTEVRAVAPPMSAHKGELPLGMFDFKVRDVTPGGAATVRVTLPAGFTPSSWLIEKPLTGALEHFDFDGRTGAEIHGNLVTLH